MVNERLDIQKFVRETGGELTIEQFLSEPFFQAWIAPELDGWRRVLVNTIEQGQEIQGLSSKEELSLQHKSLSEMRLCSFWYLARHLVPRGFQVIWENGAIHLDGDVLDTPSKPMIPHIYLLENNGERVACPVAGQFFWYDKGYSPGGIIKALHEKAPSLIYQVSEGCGVLFGKKADIKKQLGLTFYTDVMVAYYGV